VALGVAGVRIGTWTAPSGRSGCTVVLPPDGTLGAIAVRGAAPGTREAAALGVHGKLTVCHGVVLAGGSAYGLAAADGVTRWLEAEGIGYPVAGALVPIVGAAIVLDTAVLDPPSRPDAAAGAAACEAATEHDPREGGVGAGAGCSVAKVAGIGGAWRGGQGIAVRRAKGVTVGVLIVNNAVGEVVAEDGSWIARSRAPADAPRLPYDANGLRGSAPGGTPADAGGGPTQNTAIGVVVTDAKLDKRGAHRVADLGHSGVARAVRPAHTEADGDALFCLATGQVDATVDLVAHLAAEAVAEAVRRGPAAAVSHDGLPGLGDGPTTSGAAGGALPTT
jgi:L-aminopeptidase/D-esterase-like protein